MTTPTDFVAELRLLIDTVRRCDLDAPEVDVAALARGLAEARTQLEAHTVDGVPMQAGLTGIDAFFSEARPPGPPFDVNPADIFPYSPLIGPLNPISPPFRFWSDDDVVRGAGRFGTAYNGPPGGVHGGHIAALMDELLGTTGVIYDVGGFTGNLSVRYESLTPVNADLDCVARVEHQDGRKVTITGELLHDGTVCARGEGLFIRPRPADD